MHLSQFGLFFMRTGSQKSSMETQRNHLIKVRFEAIHPKHVLSPHYFNKQSPPHRCPQEFFFYLESGCFSLTLRNFSVTSYVLLFVCLFFPPGFFILSCFGSTNVIKKAGTWLGGMLKQTATLSYYCSLAKAAQSNCDPEGNVRIIAALRNTVVSVYHSSVVLISNLVNCK